MSIPADVLAQYAKLPKGGETYLLGWLVSAIDNEGQATAATLADALPFAHQWGEEDAQ